jgi:hypothetical protein
MARDLIPLSSIVNDYLLTREALDYDTSNYKQLMAYGKQAIRDELSMELGATIKSVKLTVNTTLNTVSFPNDYIEYTKIGVLDDNCRVVTLGLSNEINYAGAIALDDGGAAILDSDGIETLDATTCTPTTATNNGVGTFFYNYPFDSGNGQLFGIGGGNNARGYYRINTMDNRIELNSSFSYDYVILEYIADETMTSDPQVPVAAEDFVRKYIYARGIERKMNIPQSAKAEALNNAYLSKKKSVFKYKMFNKAEAAQQINRRFQLAPKFIYQ